MTNKKDKALEPIKKGKQYSLITSPITNKQLLMILQKTPQEHIYTRPGKGGGQWEYVTGIYFKKVLNYVFGWLWDFEIINKEEKGNQIIVQGRLTIKNVKGEKIIVKEQFGRAEIKFRKNTKEMLDYGNDCKAAATDALKKCASELGIASDIYGKNEFKNISDEKPTIKATTTPRTATRQAKTAPVQPKTQISTYNRLKDKLFKLGAKTLPEAIAKFNKITGENIKSLPREENAARSRLYQLASSPSMKK